MKTEKDITNLELKERAITAGMVVELTPDEADALNVQGMEELPQDDPQFEQDMLDSRFDPCEFDVENYQLEPKKEAE